MELERANGKKKDKGENPDLMEAIRLAETEDRYSVQRPQGFHPKKRRFGKLHLAALSEGSETGEAGSSAGKNEEEMSENEDTTEELTNVVLAALASHRKGNGKSFSKERSSKG